MAAGILTPLKSTEARKVRILLALLFIPMWAFGGDTAQSGLNWLAGCWVTTDKSSQEVWVVDKDESLIGFAVSLGAEEIVFYEVLSVKQNAEGSWTYSAHPSGQASASFTAVETGESSVLFANPNHDYPQEIRYRRDGDRLYATISLQGGADSRSFNKTACE
jgi:hypothetical protein